MEGRLSLAKEDPYPEASIQKLHSCLGIVSIRQLVYSVAIKHGIVTSTITIRHYFSYEVGGKTINTALSLSRFGFATVFDSKSTWGFMFTECNYKKSGNIYFNPKSATGVNI